MRTFDKKLTTKEKALQLNLDSAIYGTIAEIGGGQEVASYFFKAGGASGTIAKTMSAYDMTFSDSIYGKCKRYVSKEKLEKMLTREYGLLDLRLSSRAKRTRFFAYANTVETINFSRSNVGHGWMGIRFQKYPSTEPNECIIHVELKDMDAEWQQQVLGLLGVNLIHSCYAFNTAKEIVDSLKDNIRKGRMEVDMFQIQGPDFHHVDNRLMTLQLVKNGLTQVAMFGPNKDVLLPSEQLHRKNVVILRGRFRPVTYVSVDMMLKGSRLFKNSISKNGEEKANVCSLVEITLKDLETDGELDETDYLDRVDLLCSLGQTVMISNYYLHFKLVDYLSYFTKGKSIGLIIGVNNLDQIFDSTHYKNLKGGILQSFSTLFGNNVKLLVYPISKDRNPQEGITNLITSDDFKPEESLKGLYRYFKDSGYILPIKNIETTHLHISSEKVLEMIRFNEAGWETMVPKKVGNSIKEYHLFNYPYDIPEDTE